MANPITDIINFVFGDDQEKTKNNSVSSGTQAGTIDTSTKTQQQQKSSSQTGTVQATSSTAATQSHGVSQSLSNQEINAGDAVLKQLSQEFSPSDLSAIAQRISGANDTSSGALSTIFNRALGAEGDLNSGNASVLADAEKKGSRNRDAKVSAQANAAGSAFNSLTNQVFANADNDLQVSLAALGAQLKSTNRQQATAELLSAVDAMQKQSGVISTTEGAIPALAASIDSQRSGAVGNLLNAIKGGLTTQDSNSTTNTNNRTESQSTTNNVTQTLSDSNEIKDVNLNNSTVTVGDSSKTDKTNILDLIKALG